MGVRSVGPLEDDAHELGAVGEELVVPGGGVGVGGALCDEGLEVESPVGDEVEEEFGVALAGPREVELAEVGVGADVGADDGDGAGVAEVVEVEGGGAGGAGEHEEAALVPDGVELAGDEGGVAGELDDDVGQAAAGGILDDVGDVLLPRVDGDDAGVGREELEASVGEVDGENGTAAEEAGEADGELAEEAAAIDDD